MSTLDRYIIRSFLLNFSILLVVLLGLFVVVDFIADIDEFLNAGPARAVAPRVEEVASQYGLDAERLAAYTERGVGADLLIEDFQIPESEAKQVEDKLNVGGFEAALWTAWVVIDYYTPTLLLVYTFFSGLIIAGAMGFTLATMSRNRELTAMSASGISLYRVAAPILITGAGLAAMTLPIQEVVIPSIGPKLLRGKSEIKYGEVRTKAVYFIPDGRGNLMTAGTFSPAIDDRAARLESVRVLERDPQTSQLKRRLASDMASWDSERQAWRFVPEAFASEPGAAVQPNLVTIPRPVEFFPTSLTPEVLLARQASNYLRILSVTQLRQLAASDAVEPQLQDAITRTIHSRFSLLGLSVLILVVGLPSFLRVGHVSLLHASIKASVMCLGAWGGGVIMLQAGTGGLPAVLSAWLPMVILLPLAAAGLTRIRT